LKIGPQVSCVDNEENRSKDRSLWYTADDIDKIRTLADATDVMSSTRQVRAEPCQCCVVDRRQRWPAGIPAEFGDQQCRTPRRGQVRQKWRCRHGRQHPEDLKWLGWSRFQLSALAGNPIESPAADGRNKVSHKLSRDQAFQQLRNDRQIRYRSLWRL